MVESLIVVSLFLKSSFKKMVYYIQEGDVFKIPQIKNYAHGCNCAGAMGKGIALQFREKYPQMYEQYKTLCKKGELVVGSVFCYHNEDGVVFNLGTQKSWKEKAELEYIKASLCKMMEIARNYNITEIAMPAIGAGLGGRPWHVIKDIINSIASENPSIDLYVVEHYKEIETHITYIKKEWEEENIIYYFHFIGEEAVRQIEIYRDKTICVSNTNPTCGDSILYDQSLESLKPSLSDDDYITKDEFNRIWNSQRQDRLE